MGGIKINCDMCGKESMLFRTDVEGSTLNLCKECSRFGKVMAPVKVAKPVVKKVIRAPPKEEEYVLGIVENYGDLIKNKREKLEIKQEDFAKQLNEKVSLIHKIETGQFEPPLGLARKIEKFLHISLIERQELKHTKAEAPKGEHFTIGDFIKVRRK
jgi:putative transcription factor